MRAALLLLASTALVTAELTEEQRSVPLEVVKDQPGLKKIILLAGAPSNKPGQHEYFAGCKLLADCLTQTAGVDAILVANGWPENPAVLQGAASIVSYMDAGEKLAWLAPDRWAQVKALMEKGCGFVGMHQSVEVPNAQATEFQSWLGATWKKDIGCRGHWDMTFTHIPQHEVTAGVTPFPAPKDGWLYNLHFLPGAVPLLSGQIPDMKFRTTADAKAHSDRDEVIAWAYTRSSGGRSIGFTGADLHSGWQIESQRRFVTNAILWTAGVPVPSTGAPVTVAAENYAKWMDRKLIIAKKPKARTP
jgi:type 1 glutamine amidotransferase